MQKEILENIAHYFDHSLVKADAKEEEVLRFCQEARDYGFASVIVNSSYGELCTKELKDSNVHVGLTIGYPLGAATTAIKIFEVNECVKLGADELDVVMNIGKFLDKKYNEVVDDLKEVVEAFKKFGDEKIVKVIIETSIIGNDKIDQAIECVIDAGADFVKNSSGYANYGTTIEDITEMERAAGDRIQVKASGGIRSLEDAHKYIELGVTRIGGTGGVNITKEAKKMLENIN
ncbi:deoxyribose-phosphate aldolase [Tetragenococcus koreensis]|uniref:deoxyribose-phosphate aldolase n=1 Tax=Tetragenococcus koreensis TaxID=290335 RepID=UPI000F5167D9|nr:deoxyribose-phosphate aldolase [Tetragenococcus koreensis]MDN6626650.1 deoxyribose-phosphate aldolase [Pisciglobus halotolerans]MDN6730984.1 deoxyribose-phosphate aldolase [Atopostipes suicloacalis]AYW46507.1 deoxyribose-phosphate aldolase [Tetragenococcus koreensis]MCF1585335.1 deoxyribose-phosphate aldolase [Tetragenococcus koreensis]MCF1619761.1 deoxyribose-phosphate aldolase [Tetragenococcus koreensis]